MHLLKRLICAGALASIAAAPAIAQDPAPQRLDPDPNVTYGFVLDRRTTVRRDPGRTFDEPRKRKVVSTLRVRRVAAEAPGRVVLAVTYLRVSGFETGATPTDDITFDRKLGDPPSGRPETLIVGRTVEIETARDGTFVAVRGVDEAMPGNLITATATIADLRAMVAQLPPTDAPKWTTKALEGRGLLRASIEASHEIQHTTDAESSITVTGKISAAPEGAGESFEKLFRVSRGERSARYRVSRVDGLPIEGRVATAYAVEARLTGSDMEVGVDTETVVAVRRTESAGEAGEAAEQRRAAPTPGDSTPNLGMPGWIGTSRDIIRKLAGEPTRTGGGVAGGAFDTFGSFGLVYEYDDDGFVRRVTATRVAGAESFSGTLLGVKLGDALSTAVELWGEATSRREVPAEFDEVQFAYDSLLIELQVWRADGNDPAFGAFRADTVKRIRVTNRKGR